MTLELDFIRIHMPFGMIDIRCKDAGFGWPPPEKIYIKPDGGGFRKAKHGDNERRIFICVNRSTLSDGAANRQKIIRGAE